MVTRSIVSADSDTRPRERAGVSVAVLALAVTIALQTLTFSFFLGRVSSRLDSVENATQKLLDLHITNKAEGKGRAHAYEEK